MKKLILAFGVISIFAFAVPSLPDWDPRDDQYISKDDVYQAYTLVADSFIIANSDTVWFGKFAHIDSVNVFTQSQMIQGDIDISGLYKTNGIPIISGDYYWRSPNQNATGQDLDFAYNGGLGFWNSTSTNSPVPNSYGTFLNFIGNGINHNNTNNWLNTIAATTSGKIFWRQKINDGAISPWYEFYTSNNSNLPTVDWNAQNIIAENSIQFKNASVSISKDATDSLTFTDITGTHKIGDFLSGGLGYEDFSATSGLTYNSSTGEFKLDIMSLGSSTPTLGSYISFRSGLTYTEQRMTILDLQNLIGGAGTSYIGGTLIDIDGSYLDVDLTEATSTPPATNDYLIFHNVSANAPGRATISDVLALGGGGTSYSPGALLDLSGSTFNVDLSEATTYQSPGTDDYMLWIDYGTSAQYKMSISSLQSLIGGGGSTYIGGSGINISSSYIDLDIDKLTAVTPTTSDYLAIHDATYNSPRKISIAGLQTLIGGGGGAYTEGAGIDIASDVISLDIPSLANASVYSSTGDYLAIYSSLDSDTRKAPFKDYLYSHISGGDAIDITSSNNIAVDITNQAVTTPVDGDYLLFYDGSTSDHRIATIDNIVYSALDAGSGISISSSNSISMNLLTDDGLDFTSSTLSINIPELDYIYSLHGDDALMIYDDNGIGNTPKQISVYELLAGSSDRRLKQNIKDLPFLNVASVPFKTFQFKDDPEKQRFGVIAQDLQKVAPELIHTSPNGMLKVRYDDFFSARIWELENKVDDMEERLIKLEQLLEEKMVK